MRKISKMIDSTCWLTILTIVAIGLMTAGFFSPPLGVIDNSVLIGLGELALFGAIWEVDKAIDEHMDAKIKTNKVELEISNKN